ncbi:MAG: hypothetical protein EDM69_05945 [Chlorobiota bacterium]|jgi:hypothetical protein|nr:MAG: hypothetical protein EDM69_05945 [Chlorobiota bacterium]MCE7953313.1 hypothetical protein [Chlorobi bacterium CHB7]OQY78207.1 MAG: hypothetical protein B6D43_03595 [Ignavibacteriales bacterium UTCHB1]RIK48427.1 MAG: hypothetical protein DCC60_07475 [Ignavibacteriota bacterium]
MNALNPYLFKHGSILSNLKIKINNNVETTAVGFADLLISNNNWQTFRQFGTNNLIELLFPHITSIFLPR